MERQLVGVTGATGNIGGRVARLLAEAGVTQRLIVRDPARAPRYAGTTVEQASFGEGTKLRHALDGLPVVLMVSAAESADRVDQHRTFVDAAQAAGVGHLVYLSFVGASPTATFTLARDHWATEEHIRASGIRYTFLRDNLYADFVTHLAGEDGVIRGPAGDGRAAFVAQDDVGEVAAAVLRDPSVHEGATYDLTGPEAVSLDEAAQLIAQITGRTVTYHPETIAEAYASRAHYGAPPWQVDAWVSTYSAIAAGELAAISPAVAEITGHPATPLADVLRRRAR